MRALLLCLVIGLIGLAAGSASASAGITLSQSVSTSKISYNDSVLFKITLEWNGPQSAYLFRKPIRPNFDRLEVRGFSSSISSSGSGDNETTYKTYSYILVPTSGGEGTIESATIEYLIWPDSIPGELVTEAMAVSIGQPVRKQAEKNDNSLYFIIAMAVIAGIGSTVVFVLHRRKEASREIVQSPSEKSLEQLTALKESAGNDLKEFQSGLLDIIEQFLIGRFDLDVASIDDDNLDDKLRTLTLSAKETEQVAGWIKRARRDKFSPVTSEPGEIVRLEVEVRKFLEKIV